MARNNHVFVMGDITGDIYYDNMLLDGKSVPYLRLYMMVNGTDGASAISGLRVTVYGSLAELTYAYVKKGSRLAVTGHIQYRKHKWGKAFELVATDVQYIRHIDWEHGDEVRQDLVSRGEIRPTRRDLEADLVAGPEAAELEGED